MCKAIYRGINNSIQKGASREDSLTFHHHGDPIGDFGAKPEDKEVPGIDLYHQEFQVPKMEVLNLIRLFWGGFSLTQAVHTAYIGEYLHFRYLKCLVTIYRYNIDIVVYATT